MGEYTFVYIGTIAVVLTSLGEQKYLSKTDLGLPESILMNGWPGWCRCSGPLKVTPEDL